MVHDGGLVIEPKDHARGRDVEMREETPPTSSHVIRIRLVQFCYPTA